MLTLFLIVIVSILFSIFATQNTSLVSLYFYNFSLPPLPVYIIILASVLITLASSLVIQTVKSLSSGLQISSQKNSIKDLRRELAEVTKNNHKLELENAKFKAEVGEPEDTNSI